VSSELPGGPSRVTNPHRKLPSLQGGNVWDGPWELGLSSYFPAWFLTHRSPCHHRSLSPLSPSVVAALAMLWLLQGNSPWRVSIILSPQTGHSGTPVPPSKSPPPTPVLSFLWFQLCGLFLGSPPAHFPQAGQRVRDAALPDTTALSDGLNPAHSCQVCLPEGWWDL
jgi:hypothetical protein